MEHDQLNARAAGEIVAALEQEIGKVIVGQHTLIRRMLTALFAAIPFAASRGKARTGCGHLLLEGVPGVAKTLTATTLAQAISAKFQRVQLTPDLLPADILGTRIYDARTASFRIEQGPVFTNILLADEINRATPKTQSALLEAMQERQVTLADTTFPLDDPFWVLATQNPVEQEGVYTLPEAQLDRFSMMLRVGYPEAAEEVQMLQSRLATTTIERRVSPSDVNVLREFIQATVYVDDKILDYIVRLGRATRDPGEAGRGELKEMLMLGISPRSYQHLLALCRVNAFLNGRSHVLPGDVKEIFCDVTRHRIVRTVRAQAEGVDADAILADLLSAVPIP
ncbi:MAG TPA: AAA family ATPase [Vicinamibacterales bacterium]|jgi:MoxR-like ATPase